MSADDDDIHFSDPSDNEFSDEDYVESEPSQTEEDYSDGDDRHLNNNSLVPCPPGPANGQYPAEGGYWSPNPPNNITSLTLSLPNNQLHQVQDEMTMFLNFMSIGIVNQ
jgi:hypothetical protein